MSLDHLIQKTQDSADNHVIVKNVPLFRPPEYEISELDWRELIKVFNSSDRPARLAVVIQQYIRSQNPDKKISDSVIAISEIVERDGHYFTDLSFEKDKIGLTAWVIFKQEDLQLILVSAKKGVGGISRVSLSYIPD